MGLLPNSGYALPCSGLASWAVDIFGLKLEAQNEQVHWHTGQVLQTL